MRTASRLRHSQMASLAGLLGTALLLAPPPASADRDDWEDRGRSRSHRHHDHDDHHRHKGKGHHRHGDWCPPQHFGRPYARNYGPRYYARPVRHARFHCEPCGGWYDDRESFHYHVHHHHHVPRGVLPLVIVATVFGAVFGGY